MSKEKEKPTNLMLNEEARNILSTKAIGFDGFNPGKRGWGKFLSELVIRRYKEIQLARDADHITGQLSKVAELLEAAGKGPMGHPNAAIAAKLVRLAVDLLSE